MPISASLVRKLDRIQPELREVLLDLAEELERAVTKDEFRELRDVVRELAEAQRRTEQRVNELAEAQRETERRLNELAEAQRRTEQRVNELAEAQRETERRLNELAGRVNELAEAQRRTEEELRKLAIGQRRLRQEVGGLSRSVAYALENEAYRNLPRFLRERYGIEVTDRLVRFELRGEEINLFARAKRDGEDVVLVGEAVLRLDDKGKLRKIRRKAELVSQEYGLEVVPVVVTHFATGRLLEEARKAGFLVVQTFEW